MPHNFGRHVANEIIEKSSTFIQHASGEEAWHALSDPHRGRMTKADLAEGEKRLRAATASIAESQKQAGGTHEPTYQIDSADEAASAWLVDQLTHVRGALHDADDHASLATLRALRTPGEAHQTHVANIRAYANAAHGADALGKAITATYASTKSRDAILKDGLHLADALAADLGEVGAAKGAGKAATTAKDASVDRLAKWLHRWSLVAHRVCSPGALSALGLAGARHHPEHRPRHPAAAANQAPAPPVQAGG